jgi:hypothetical protein
MTRPATDAEFPGLLEHHRAGRAACSLADDLENWAGARRALVVTCRVALPLGNTGTQPGCMSAVTDVSVAGWDSAPWSEAVRPLAATGDPHVRACSREHALEATEPLRRKQPFRPLTGPALAAHGEIVWAVGGPARDDDGQEPGERARVCVA